MFDSMNGKWMRCTKLKIDRWKSGMSLEDQRKVLNESIVCKTACENYLKGDDPLWLLKNSKYNGQLSAHLIKLHSKFFHLWMSHNKKFHSRYLTKRRIHNIITKNYHNWMIFVHNNSILFTFSQWSPEKKASESDWSEGISVE